MKSLKGSVLLTAIYFVLSDLAFSKNINQPWHEYVQPNGVKFIGREWGDLRCSLNIEPIHI
jgi:hypothetical protein